MIRLRLFREIVLPYTAFALLVAAGLVWLGGAVQGRAVRDGVVQRLETAARAVAVVP